jgi:hypothetical protein
MLLALALGVALGAAPQDSTIVRALLAAERVPSGASTVLVISVETNGATPGDIPVPTLPAGLVLGPVSDFTQLQIAFPGGRRRTTRREIVILARAPGQYRIPPVTVQVEGRRYATRALDLTVVPSGFGRSPGPGDGAEPGARLRAWISPDTVYAGEQILYRAEAAFPEALRLRQTRAPVFDPPATSGFWVYDVPEPVSVGLRVVGNDTYEVQSFRQVLFPLNAGQLEIPPAGLRYEFRAGSMFSPEARELASEGMSVYVRPLPVENRPAAFDGAVGQYSLQVAISAQRVRVHDAVRLQAIIEGSGNIKALARPELPALRDIDVFPGAERAETGFADDQVSGRKQFEWVLVPRKAGTLSVPAITFAWFDPHSERYHQASSSVLPLTVEPAGSMASSDATPAPLRAHGQASPLAFTRAPWFASLQVLPLLLLLALALRRHPRPAPRAPRDAPVAQELATLARIGDDRVCLERLATLLQREITRGAHPDVGALTVLLERVRQARYAPEPANADTCARLLAEASTFWRVPRGRAARSVTLLLLLAAGHGELQAQSLAAGLEAHGEGDYRGSLEAFAGAARAQPDDAAAWYNLGHAFRALDEPGRAAWAWLRTLELEPRAADARRNLRVIGADAALAELAPRVPLSSDELRLGAALAWWLGALLLVARLVRRARIAAALGVVLLLVAAAALVVLAARGRPPLHAVALENVALHAAPALRSDSLGEVVVMQPLRLRELRGEWARVVSADLREGWVERRLIGRL